MAKKIAQKVIKKVGLGFLLELIPFFGDIAFCWTIVAYSILKEKGSFSLVPSPEAAIMMPIAIGLDLAGLGFFILSFLGIGIPGSFILDFVGIFIFGAWTFFQSGTLSPKLQQKISKK